MLSSLTILAALFFAPPPGYEVVTLSGKVVDLSSAIKGFKIEADREPIEKQVALVREDGSIVPLISDEASRAFFLDKRMRDRKAELVGRRYPGLPYFQVLSFKVDEGGRSGTPEYYCEICAISVRYPQICPCCQGDMVLRMKDEGR